MEWGDKVWINGHHREWYIYQGQTESGYPILETWGNRPFTRQFIYYGNSELIPAETEE